MMLHLCHIVIIHAMMWLPLIVWSLEELRRRFSAGWFLAGSLAVAGSALSGHPQIPLYTLCLSGAVVIFRGWQAPVGRWRYYGTAALLLILGVGSAAIQLIPTAELARQSLRASLSFTEFVAYSLPPEQIPMLLFPLVFGGSPGSLYGIPYFGAWGSGINDIWGPTELSGYVGLLPLMLAALGVVAGWRMAVPLFWFGVGALSFLLALGEATPLASLVFHLPVLNSFRAPARHFAEMSLAVSVLSGFGVAAILRGRVSRRAINRTVFVGGCVMLGCAVSFWLFADHFRSLADQKGIEGLSLLPWANPATGLPLLIFLAAAAALIFWGRRPRSRVRSLVLLAVLTLDLASFGWFSEWHYDSPGEGIVSPPAFAAPYKAALAQTHQRLLPVRGALGAPGEFPPNLSQLWELPSASGYGPLMLSRVSRLLSMVPYGAVDESWQDAANRSLDVFAVRYVVLPGDQRAGFEGGASGGRWGTNDLSVTLGSGCGDTRPDSFRVDLPTPVRATQLGVVSALACSSQVADGATVARVTLIDIEGQVFEQHIAAGRDTAEWAFDCADVRPQMKHGRATLFRSYPAEREHIRCEGHDYVSTLRLPAAGSIKSLTFTWVGTAGALALKKIRLLDEPSGQSHPITPASLALADGARWRLSQSTGQSDIYENLRAMPRAWLVHEVIGVTAEEALRAIKSSRLSDGRAFDPSQTALVEEPFTFKAERPAASADTPQVLKASSDVVEVQTDSTAASFLVMSDVYYPGWQATIDGAAARLWQTNYALRGVSLPPGRHIVRLEFKPGAFYQGAAVSAVSLLTLAAFTLFQARRAHIQRRRAPDE